MVAYKNISKFIIAVMAVAVVACILAVAYSDKISEMTGDKGISMEYESKLFNTDEPIKIDIQMDEDKWSTMLANASSEIYYSCDVVVNGTKFQSVGIRPKGNTSLSAIAMDSTTDRFSLKLEFDQYVEGQTCFGLDKLILNNNYADATNMKEAVIYDMYQYLGADASLYNYAEIYLNGEYWGVYLALEAVEESFALRNYGTEDGELYKPDSLEMGGGASSSSSSGMSMPGKDFSNFDSSKIPSGNFNFDTSNMPSGNFNFNQESTEGAKSTSSTEGFNPGSMPNGGSFNPGSMPNGGSFNPGSMPNGGSFDSGDIPSQGGFDISGMGGMSSGGNGADLNYTDDDLNSYSLIWEGSVTDSSKSDHRRVVTAIKNINEGTDLEKYLDVDNVLKYMAVHTFAVNMDSLSGSMSHNYYIYEYNGQLNIIPWDYNLSFGGMSMGMGNATDMINDAIDTPFSGTNFFDALLENEEYLARYHEYLQQLIDEYVDGGRFDEVYNNIRSTIDSLVETDPTAFYTYDEYLNAVDILYNTVKLRAESIRGQLNGTIPSTDDGQKADSSALIDGASIDMEAMGQFNMGMSFSGGASGDSSTGGAGGSFSQPPANGGGSMDFSGMDMSSFAGMGGSGANQITGIIYLLASLGLLLIAYLIVKVLKRKRRI